MKAIKFSAVVCCTCAPLLWGCASVPRTQATAPNDGTDYAKMALIEHAALANGVKVIWLNPPQKARTPGS